MTKKPFEKGERVKFEWSNWNEPLTYIKGTVIRVSEHGRLDITPDHGPIKTYCNVSPLVCARLVKKPRREWELNISQTGIVAGIKAVGDNRVLMGAFYRDNETVRVREVRKK